MGFTLVRKHGVVALGFVQQQLQHMQQKDPTSWCVGIREELLLTEMNGLCSCVGPLEQKLYCLKTLNTESVDKYRDVLVALFGRKNALRKSDVKKAAMQQLSEEIPDVFYGKIMREFAQSSRGLWTLKSGHYTD